MKFLFGLGVILCLPSPAAAQRLSPNALLATLESPNHSVQAVAFSSDGALLAAGGSFNAGVRIWNVADRSVVATLHIDAVQPAGIKRLAFSEDGKLFAAASDRGSVILWSVGSWQSPRSVLTVRGNANDLSFSPDSTKLALSSDEAAVLYDLKTAEETILATGDRFGNSYNGISFSPDGAFIVVCGDMVVKVWDVKTKKMVRDWKPMPGGGFFGRLSPDGNHVIAGGGAIYGRKSVEVWSFPTGRKLAEVSEFRDGLFALAISHSGSLFAVAGGNYGSGGDLSLWSIDGPNGVGSLSHSDYRANSEASGGLFIENWETWSYLFAGRNRFVNTDFVKELGYVSFGRYPIPGLAFSPDDKILAAASEDGVVLLYDVDRIRGPQVKKQDDALCGEILREGNKAFVVPLATVPTPMGRDFEFAWKVEIVNADSVTGLDGSPVAMLDWNVESSAANDVARVNLVRRLGSRAELSSKDVNHIVFGDIQNPGWNEGFIVKIYGEGNFVVASNTGRCLANGSLDQLKTDFESVKKRLVDHGLLDIAREPRVLGFDHYRTRFIELAQNGVPELRSDAEYGEVLLKGGPLKKREAIASIFKQEEAFINSLRHAGMKSPTK